MFGIKRALNDLTNNVFKNAVEIDDHKRCMKEKLQMLCKCEHGFEYDYKKAKCEPRYFIGYHNLRLDGFDDIDARYRRTCNCCGKVDYIDAEVHELELAKNKLKANGYDIKD